jgi:ribosomal protein S18 acetylase RimI-like enzyme
MQPVSAGLLEQLIFSKPYFDPAGLIVAVQENEVVGFAHAGFGANEDETQITRETGTTHQLLLRADYRQDGLADELLVRAESYLRDRGAKVVYAGGIRPMNAFYLGLYGGSELPGVLLTDPILGATCMRGGYREIDRVHILQLDLACFRPPITREQRQLRRDAVCHETYDPPVRSWWEAVTIGDYERLRLSLTSASNSQPLATVDFWDIEPLSTSWGVATAGMLDLRVESECRRKGLATYLLSEAFGRLRARGIVCVEAQTMQHNQPALALYAKLGFKKVDEGVVYRKDS